MLLLAGGGDAPLRALPHSAVRPSWHLPVGQSHVAGSEGAPSPFGALGHEREYAQAAVANRWAVRALVGGGQFRLMVKVAVLLGGPCRGWRRRPGGRATTTPGMAR